MKKNHKNYKRRCNSSFTSSSRNLGKTFVKSQSGFTMVELLVAVAIGLFLVSGVFQMFIANKQSSRIQNNLSHVQENGRFAISEIARVTRMTGLKSDPTDSTVFATAATAPVTGTDNANLGADDVSISFQGVSGLGTVGGTVDCLGTRFFATVPATTITNRFYLDTDANGVTSLFCSETSAAVPNPQPLIEDVSDMEITYGVDTLGSGDAAYYVNATTVTAGTAGVPDWSRVVSIRFSLLVESREDAVTTTAQTYQFDGAAVTATDNRLYKVFNITIALRNRLG